MAGVVLVLGMYFAVLKGRAGEIGVNSAIVFFSWMDSEDAVGESSLLDSNPFPLSG